MTAAERIDLMLDGTEFGYYEVVYRRPGGATACVQRQFPDFPTAKRTAGRLESAGFEVDWGFYNAVRAAGMA